MKLLPILDQLVVSEFEISDEIRIAGKFLVKVVSAGPLLLGLGFLDFLLVPSAKMRSPFGQMRPHAVIQQADRRLDDVAR
jgi:hypothetical protein